jgi:hypothetical protein
MPANARENSSSRQQAADMQPAFSFFCRQADLREQIRFADAQ